MDEYINKTKFEELMRKKARSNFDLYYADKSKHYHDNAVGYNIAADEAYVFPASDVQPIDRWISIEDSLPEPYSNVILYTNYKATAYGFFRGEYYEGKPLFSMTMSNNAENSWYEEVRITHWQPLPDPPKEG